LPAIADKTFLITIADRSVTGLVARDQMVGPYQTPVADVAVTTTGFLSYTGEAMAMGERTGVAPVSAPASGRMAIGEAITNMAGAAIGSIRKIRLSANWMCACGEDSEDASLYDTVSAVSMELCPALGVSIPVGKDSLSMRTVWTDSDGRDHKITAPLSLVVSSFATVTDVRKTVTPDLKPGESVLLLVDLGRARNRLGGSCLAQVYNQVGSDAPDLDRPEDLVKMVEAVQELIEEGLLLAYHDRSDGGLLVTLAEMCFAGMRGVRVTLNADGGEKALAALFAEELGAVLQVRASDESAVLEVFRRHAVGDITARIGEVTDDGRLSVVTGGESVYAADIRDMKATWHELTYRMQALRDSPDCALEEHEAVSDRTDPGMGFTLTYDPASTPTVSGGARPRMAILREQGINGQVEMAAAFHLAGFESIDVHMTDLLSGRARLDEFVGLVACGGFSYGDVLGAGCGWARSILFNEELREMFRTFFHRVDTFSLGVCNGCQMMSQLKDIIPGAGMWPSFRRNVSEQFEARYVSVEIMDSPSILLRGMAGSRVAIPVAHGEGRVEFTDPADQEAVARAGLVAMRYVDNHGQPASRYPANPNGSPGGMTAFCSADGRATIMMPHPERGFRSVQMSYRPLDMFEGEEGPWTRMFRNAREFIG
jgi:phosphoribosylformylglycinamidine synthase